MPHAQVPKRLYIFNVEINITHLWHKCHTTVKIQFDVNIHLTMAKNKQENRL